MTDALRDALRRAEQRELEALAEADELRARIKQLEAESTDRRSYYTDVYDFHRKFDLPRPESYRHLSDELFHFRKGFLQEELDEFVEAYGKQERAKILDALVDLVYVAIGTAIMMGCDFNAAWRLVQDANMNKVRAQRAEDSKRGTAFDVVKPKGWVAPDLEPLVRG